MKSSVDIRSIMEEFAKSTGLTDDAREPRRYLWTDSFAVFNFLQLYLQTGEQKYEQLALRLVDQVHSTLGKHRKDSGDSGWLSGLDEKEGGLHPTKGGLRIGKQLAERRSDDIFDEQLEWERDGQYYHYLTKWMQALNCVSRITGNGIYNQWAMELAKVASAAFVHASPLGGANRMYWKMSIDLSRPLVASMGQHDPLDGLITYQQLEVSAKRLSVSRAELSLESEIADLSDMCAGRNWATEDALGIGGLLVDAYRLMQLIDTYHLHEVVPLKPLFRDIDLSLQSFAARNSLNLPAEHRLAFRELGLAIGLHAIDGMTAIIDRDPGRIINANQIRPVLARFSDLHPVREAILSFWAEPAHRSVNSWLEHADINSVMLATGLMPDAYLLI